MMMAGLKAMYSTDSIASLTPRLVRIVIAINMKQMSGIGILFSHPTRLSQGRILHDCFIWFLERGISYGKKKICPGQRIWKMHVLAKRSLTWSSKLALFLVYFRRNAMKAFIYE